MQQLFEIHNRKSAVRKLHANFLENDLPQWCFALSQDRFAILVDQGDFFLIKLFLLLANNIKLFCCSKQPLVQNLSMLLYGFVLPFAVEVEILHKHKASYLTVQALGLNALQNVLLEVRVVEGPVLDFCCDLNQKEPDGNESQFCQTQRAKHH